jgi:hypothetical protein
LKDSAASSALPKDYCLQPSPKMIHRMIRPVHSIGVVTILYRVKAALCNHIRRFFQKCSWELLL